MGEEKRALGLRQLKKPHRIFPSKPRYGYVLTYPQEITVAYEALLRRATHVYIFLRRNYSTYDTIRYGATTLLTIHETKIHAFTSYVFPSSP